MNGETLQNVFYAELPGGYTLADLSALAAVMDAQVQGTWKSQQVTDAVYDHVEVRGLAKLNDFVASNNANAGPGVAAGGSLPNNATIAIKKSSGLTGRSARGRTYWIGVPNVELRDANENEVEAAYLADVVTAVDSIRSSIDSTPLWVPVLVSRFSGGVERDEGETFPWVTTESVNNRMDSQRNRLP
jgi:hypothetical protein